MAVVTSRQLIWEKFRFRAVRPSLPAKSEWIDLLDESYARNHFSNGGPLAVRLEQELQREFGNSAGECILANNATNGLAACMIATGESGTALFPAFTFPATLSAIKMAALEPRLMDVSFSDWYPSVETLKKSLEETGSKVVVLVAPFGFRCDFTSHAEVCRSYGAHLIIDNAAGLGVPRHFYEAQKNVYEVFSMHATKPFGVGEGGAIFTNAAHADAVREASNFALHSYETADGPDWGINNKMSELHAAVGLAQLKNYKKLRANRLVFVEGYIKLLQKYSNLSYEKDVARAPWQCFPVLMPNENAAGTFTKTAGEMSLEIRRYYRPSMSKWNDSITQPKCPEAEELSDRVCCLPVYAEFGTDEPGEIFKIVEKCLDEVLKL